MLTAMLSNSRVDASPIDDEPNAIKKNLTEWGKEVIGEMNRLGMIIDLSHVSEGVMLAVLEHSKAEVVFSHSSVFSLHNHHRNVKDHVLQELKVKNGLIMINFYSGFIGGNDTIDDVISKFDNDKDAENYFKNIFLRSYQLRERLDWTRSCWNWW